MLTYSLRTFHFNLEISSLNVRQTLDSFHTSFWIEEKRWFVAYYDHYVFSVPYFLNMHLQTPSRQGFKTTLNDTSIIDQNIKAISLPTNSIGGKRRQCTHVENLKIHDFVSLNALSNVINLNRIKCLTIFSLTNILALVSLLQAMPHVENLRIKFITKLNLFEISSRIQFKRIHTLSIHGFVFDDFNIEGWCSLFPNVNNLNVGHFESNAQLVRFLDGFEHLSYASIEIKSSCLEHKSIEIRRFTQDSFVFQVRQLNNPNMLSSVNLWFEERVCYAIIFNQCGLILLVV